MFMRDSNKTLAPTASIAGAIASYDKAIEIHPNHDAAWYNRGNVLGILEKYAEAIAND
jgi:tetratricopeptide (TPR) repeat protein